ncbi:helix-turn-helix domain-containing protein [Lachnoclostridium sp.]|uniref:helix-turn-helix domain-containing protein n=1 Tax=Lachnoclostridium sp. TaxID=2028282 RepID=UPI0028A22902|nr:helix-turn-helix domain-containing protein [Lachnoclostridium sp.]
MDNEKMALFIAEQRKIKKLTQKELAAKLGVTDKAVSKWERGLSCPDISLLSTLSDILGVTTGELLNGERAEKSEVANVDSIVESTIEYAETVTKRKSKDISNAFAVAITSLCLLGIMVCFICNFAITGKLTWAWFPISSIIYMWLLVIPTIIWKKRGVCISLICTSLFTIPYLYVLERIIGIDRLIMPIGTPVAIVSILYLWIVYVLLVKFEWSRYLSSSIALILGIPLSLGINFILSKQIGEPIMDIWDILVYSLLVILAVIVYGTGYFKNNARK